MPSQKNTLKNNITYLQSRRSGVEFAIGKSADELKAYIFRVGHEIKEQSAKLYAIEKEESDFKEAEKYRKAQEKKARLK